MARANRLTVHALGVVMIFTWGSTYYLIAVLAAPIVADTGWPLEWVVGSLSLGLLVAGLSAPTIGDAISRHGGRPILALGCLIMALGLAMIAAAPNLAIFMAGWAVLGIGMAAGLYDAAFSTLGGIYGEKARPSITTLTLWGGFASTVCWPLSAALVEAIGWRGACFAYAAVLAGVCLPLILAIVPQSPRRPKQSSADYANAALVLPPRERAMFWLFASIQIIAGLFVTIVSVHLLTLLQARGISLTEAVTLGALIGPAQVGARVLEMLGRGRHHPMWTLSAAVVLCAGGLIVLAAGLPIIGLALILYGAGNGIFSIARGALPLSLFGPGQYAPIMGRLARPGLIAQAAAPMIGAILISRLGYDALLHVIAALATLNVLIAGMLWQVVRQRPLGRIDC
ncbi:MFS transporter [Chelativorans sp. AA-79]|uniref:MFS transporter n=1 Tax=Chelativorans sp. AA-79 TaxID=3028735 RepID=UPI0023F83EFF|nr:MFS transporter [Chelativorans sp. AA-79]WEX09202.1 MFS transporter [Chelativorans sp. AA-79]